MPKKEALAAMDEIDILAQLTECNQIVKYYDSFVSGTKVNIVMDYCESGDLQKYMREFKIERKHINEKVIVNIFLQICLGVNFLHERGILHRDIKSLNIFLKN